VGVFIEAPTEDHQDEFVAAVRASASLHRPWIAPAARPETYRLWLARTRADDQMSYLLRHEECGALVGYASVNNIVRRALQSGYLGYGAFRGHEGRGLMTIGLRAVLRDLFTSVGLHRVEANIQPANERSLAMARRLGFTQEGFSRRYLMVDGEWRDHERWALLAEDFAHRGV
jgi:ribosomal-protein-alanine N-acetyltransferase